MAMTDLDRRERRPGLAFAGFLGTSVLLLAVAVAADENRFADLGWTGGEYAYLVIGTAFGAIVLGCLAKPAGPPWNSVGTGLILAGVLGLLAVVAIIVLFLVTLGGFSAPVPVR